jgi:hypothetical protein
MLAVEFPAADRRAIEELATAMALRDMAEAQIGIDPKATVSAWRKLEAHVAYRRRGLEMRARRRGDDAVAKQVARLVAGNGAR